MSGLHKPRPIDWDHLTVAPWEKLPGETQKAFSYFVHFRDMPMGMRSVSQAARDLGKRRETISEQSVKWHWRKRSDWWDAYMDAVARHEQIEEIKRMNERHARTAMLILSKVGQRLVGDETAGIKAIDVNKLEASDLARLTEVASKVERLSRGAESDRVGVHTSEEIEVKISFDTEPVYAVGTVPDAPHDLVEGTGFKEITDGT